MKAILRLLTTFTTSLIVTLAADAQRHYAQRNSSLMIGIETTYPDPAQSLNFSTDVEARRPINSLQDEPAFGRVTGTHANGLFSKLAQRD